MSKATITLSVATGVLLLATTAFAQTYAITAHVVSGGGGASSEGAYELSGTIGQSDAGASMSGGSYGVIGGFWTELTAGSGFTDDPVTPGVTVIRALHFLELRARVNTQRVRFGLPATPWINPLGVGLSVVSAQHLSELRAALLEAFQAAGVQPPPFKNTLVPGITLIRAAHLTQLRAAIQILEAQ